LFASFKYFVEEVRFLSAILDTSGAEYQCAREKPRMELNHPHPCYQVNSKLILRKPTPSSGRDYDGTQKTASMSTRIFDGVT
jgi:hypothetical protein